jgi:N-acetylneuraminic acid mutarotase
LAEKYDPAQDKWESIEIAGGTPVGCFGFCPLAPNSGEILILGGTDGDML